MSLTIDYFDNLDHSILDENVNLSIDKNDFKPEYIGRGIWHSWHLVSFNSKTEIELKVIYNFIILYVNNILCEKCKEHANSFILKYDITDLICDEANVYTFSEKYNLINKWLYLFHKSANSYSGKKSPSYKNVKEFYLGNNVCTDC